MFGVLSTAGQVSSFLYGEEVRNSWPVYGAFDLCMAVDSTSPVFNTINSTPEAMNLLPTEKF